MFINSEQSHAIAGPYRLRRRCHRCNTLVGTSRILGNQRHGCVVLRIAIARCGDGMEGQLMLMQGLVREECRVSQRVWKKAGAEEWKGVPRSLRTKHKRSRLRRGQRSAMKVVICASYYESVWSLMVELRVFWYWLDGCLGQRLASL